MKNIYLPEIAVIKDIKEEAFEIKTYVLEFLNKETKTKFTFNPGQFIELSVFGFGEAPFSISSSPYRKKNIEICVKKAGSLTKKLHELKIGDEVGIRGPYGNGFPVEKLRKKSIIFLGGGIGVAPLKSLIDYLLKVENGYKEMYILYGAKRPKDIVGKENFSFWSKKAQVYLTVDVSDKSWKGEVGPVTNLLPKVSVKAKDCLAVLCGPPAMINAATDRLREIGLFEENIIATLERYMKCGVGKCGHCTIGNKYTCIDGPVFTSKEIKELDKEF
ncbi:MAG: FAD/NAD(P)-binding protein [bacterium]|nr:FAD/NAD(P)-binding protein [bacterium]